MHVYMCVHTEPREGDELSGERDTKLRAALKDMGIDGDAIANGEEYFGSVSMHVCVYVYGYTCACVHAYRR